MAHEKYDPVTGKHTTGHDWNGIEELNTPVPRVVLFFLAAGIVFSVIYWILMPAFPLGWTYTKGVLGYDQRDVVTREVQEAESARAVWIGEIETQDLAKIAADPELMRHVRDTGKTMFGDNCAVCHGLDGQGGPGFPSLTDSGSLWGGEPEALAETIRIGINAAHDETRFSEMPAFRDVLEKDDRLAVIAHIRHISGQKPAKGDAARLEDGNQAFQENCVSCHGPEGKGDMSLGAPDLTDGHWIYGGDAKTLMTTVNGGRQGHMPAWENRLPPANIKLLTLYLGTLGGEGQ